ncbi:hypothetical protein GCM10009780_26460 [Actinomadura alba]
MVRVVQADRPARTPPDPALAAETVRSTLPPLSCLLRQLRLVPLNGRSQRQKAVKHRRNADLDDLSDQIVPYETAEAGAVQVLHAESTRFRNPFSTQPA